MAHNRCRFTHLAAALLAILLVGCGTSTGARPGVARSATATPIPTVIPSPSPTTTPTATIPPTPGSCAEAAAAPFPGESVARSGDLIIIQSFGLAYPARKLPDGAPLKPFQLAAQDGPALDAQLPRDPAVNPHLGGDGFDIAICNASTTQPHTVSAVTIRIDTFTAYTGQLSSWNRCDDGGCSGAIASPNCFRAAFPANAGAGAIVPANHLVSSQPYCPTLTGLPDALAPGAALSINLGLTAPTVAGTYTFSVGAALDSGAPIYAPFSRPILLAPDAHKWSMLACSAPAMKTQLPPTTNPPYFICPQS